MTIDDKIDLTDKELAKLESLSEVERKLYDRSVKDFRDERTYRITNKDVMKEALAHRYGIWMVERYRRTPNREKSWYLEEWGVKEW